MTLDILTADRTYFVRTDGNDANDGLSDNAAGAFRTIQHAYDNAANTIFLSGYKLTIKIGHGVFEGLETCRGIMGSGDPEDVVIDGGGDATVVSPPAGSTVAIQLGKNGVGNVILTLANMTLSAPSGYGILAFGGGVGVHYRGINFGSCGANHINLAHCAWGYQTGPCKISGSALSHLAGSTNAVIAIHGGVLDVVGQPGFSQGFVTASGGARVYPWPLSGAGLNNITGRKFTLYPGATIDGGGNVNNLPGNQAGINDRGYYT